MKPTSSSTVFGRRGDWCLPDRGGPVVFFMRSFMDDITLQRIPEGGMEVRMVKKLGAAE